MTPRLPADASCFFLALCLLLPGAISAQPPDPGDPCRIGEAVILATNSVRLATDVTIHSGDVVVNDPSNGGTLGNGFELYIDKKTAIAGSLKADRIKIFSQATVAGSVFYNQLTNQGAIGGSLYSPLSLPIFENLPAFTPTSPPRGPVNDVTVGIGQTLTLAAGDYRNVVVNTSGTILFSGGIYNLESVDLVGDGANLRFLAPTEVRIHGKFRTRKLAFIGPAAGSGVAASSIVFYIAGSNGLDGGLNSTPEAARIGTDSTASANFYVPNGTLRLELRSVATGAFLARDVQVDSRVQVSLASAFQNRPPVAVPQEVLTHGAGSVVITLAGSDPEGQNLTFAIASGPSAGTLSAVTPIVPTPIEDPSNPGTFIQPPITQATVTYSPNSPAAEAPDSFTFRVTDGCGKTGMAVIEINPFDPSPPPPSPTAVDAIDLVAETVTDTAVTITLAAGAPNGDTLSFSIQSLPGHGSLRSGSTAIESVPFSLGGSTVTYTPGSGFTGTDAFNFRASGTPSGTADTATVTVAIAERLGLATDAELETPFNQPVEVTLIGNPGGSGTSGSPATTPPGPTLRSLVLRATTGASIAGNVSDANGDGLGDGRDNLPGSAPVLIAAGVDVNLGANPSGAVTDPGGDATNDSRDDPANPDLVSATVASDGTSLSLTVHFVVAGFSAATSRGSFVLDTDENPATGFPGIDAANNDAALLGIEFLVNIGADLGANAEVLKFISAPNTFSNVGTFAATVLADGYSVAIPLSALDNDDGRLTFKAETQSFLGPGFTGILDYMPDLGLAPGQARTGVQGVVRIQAEWNITSIGATDPDQVENATVTLSTLKGTVDDLDTIFFAGTADQDGVLAAADFQAPAVVIPGVTMPVPDVPTGTEGTFVFDVTRQVREAIGRGDDFFSIQGRVDEGLAGGGFRRGLQVRSTASGNLLANKEPKLEVVTVGAAPSNLRIEVVTLPTHGTLTLGGVPVSAGQTFLNTNLVSLLYTPNLNFSGADSITYRVTEGLFADLGIIGIFVDFSDGCVENGRPPGCAPAGN